MSDEPVAKRPRLELGEEDTTTVTGEREQDGSNGTREAEENNWNDVEVTISSLPLHVVYEILLKTAVELRLGSSEVYFEDVYRALAPVCKEWREILRQPEFYSKVKQRVHAIDPTTRWLKTPQAVNMTGVRSDVIISRVAFNGTLLFVIEHEYDDPADPYGSHADGVLYVYDCAVTVSTCPLEGAQTNMQCKTLGKLKMTVNNSEVTLNPVHMCIAYNSTTLFILNQVGPDSAQIWTWFADRPDETEAIHRRYPVDRSFRPNHVVSMVHLPHCQEIIIQREWEWIILDDKNFEVKEQGLLYPECIDDGMTFVSLDQMLDSFESQPNCDELMKRLVTENELWQILAEKSGHCLAYFHRWILKPWESAEAPYYQLCDSNPSLTMYYFQLVDDVIIVTTTKGLVALRLAKV